MNTDSNNGELEKQMNWQTKRLSEGYQPQRKRGYQPKSNTKTSSNKPPIGGTSAQKPNKSE